MGARQERYAGCGGNAKGQAKAIQRYSAKEDRLTGKGQVERSGAVVILCRAQKPRAVARYAGRCPEPRQGRSPETPAPFPFCAMFRNGPRPQGCVTENLFKTRKDSPPPRTNRAPLTAAGRSEDSTMTRERGLMQSRFAAQRSLPLAGLG